MLPPGANVLISPPSSEAPHLTGWGPSMTPTTPSSTITMGSWRRAEMPLAFQSKGSAPNGGANRLKWQPDLPAFFVEYDRLTTLLSLTGDETKIALLRNKLPQHVQKLLAEQALKLHLIRHHEGATPDDVVPRSGSLHLPWLARLANGLTKEWSRR
ncbi:hypothetical protein F5883DRAFT_183663 [Diaporthe sp. PMI_573]|nr:hypothetical protein F5883DRAFT_183663 [Diaporthaceae sp. PMI_573]